MTEPPDIETKLMAIWSEIAAQSDLVANLSEYGVRDNKAVQRIGEWIDHHGEYDEAYTTLVAILEKVPFKLSGPNAVRLLEVGLIFGYKTGRIEDAYYRRPTR